MREMIEKRLLAQWANGWDYFLNGNPFPFVAVRCAYNGDWQARRAGWGATLLIARKDCEAFRILLSRLSDAELLEVFDRCLYSLYYS